MKRKLVISIAALAWGVLSCAQMVAIADPTAPPTTSRAADAGDPQLRIEDGTIRGAMGDVTSFSSHAATVLVNSNYREVRIDAEDAAAPWWVMTALGFSSSLSSDVWAPGVSRTMALDGPRDEGYVALLGCSGPTHGDFTFDAHASSCTVTVSAGAQPGWRVVTFVAVWDRAGIGSPQSVTGSFTIPAN